METIIQEKLKQIEAEHDVHILYACESGSRAWGFASTDSDFDVRFIYAGKQPDYLSIRDRRDVIELPVNEVLDISGWDLRKALQLFHKSNVPLYEWLQSPIVYQQHAAFMDDMALRMPSFFSLRAGFHHYLSMAINTFENDLRGNDMKLKRYFYALRPALACLWIQRYEILPPMEFRLLRTVVEDENWQEAIDRLLEQKQSSTEKTLIPAQPVLHTWLEDTLDACKERAGEIPAQKGDLADLDNLFRKYIRP
ncbi:nucleotidyltransferase domain-containing protein [Chitinophaga barathri]|uniref:Nucleotidyltransferase domain-containing protein n=1 Tax=Chitinophaga barathri TaxID=1647451 RepID=A0A3N4MYR4_9BACT|nr:nucleotidyltransferase domain-containing protein [Chitinophaga barathri]RPD40563.1 nucleotidyltransferase domain-containing protein [Chitinophaga barathri]